MKKNNKLVLLIFFGFIVSNVTLAQPKKATDTIPTSLIKASVDKFANYLSPQNIRDLGLKSKEELLSLKPGIQYKFFLIGLEDIKKYKKGDDVRKLIKEFPSMEVALVDGSGEIKISVSYIKRNNKWDLSTFGLTPDVSAVWNVQQLIGDNTIKKGTLIRIPALQASFIAIDSPGILNFITLRANPALGFKKGQMQSASDAIWKLVDAAKHYNGLPN